jgi:hypothetical protein
MPFVLVVNSIWCLYLSNSSFSKDLEGGVLPERLGDAQHAQVLQIRHQRLGLLAQELGQVWLVRDVEVPTTHDAGRVVLIGSLAAYVAVFVWQADLKYIG